VIARPAALLQLESNAIVELNPLRSSTTFDLATPPLMLLALLPTCIRQAVRCDLLNALVFAFALAVGVSSHAAANPDDAFASALEKRMPELLLKYRVPGAVVSCITNGDVAWTKAFGRANLKTGAPMQPDMIFNHGSNGKVLTMWGIMRLVEQGKVELDAPANRYLKRWKLRSSQFDPEGVTIRRMLGHRAGLTVHGFLDYDQRRRLPTLVEMLEGKNQIQLFGEANGPVYIKWQPGSTNVYSGGGFVLLQMIIEDVTGEPFAAFMHREVTAPLGIGGLRWVWTRRLENAAPMTYGELQEEIGYRQLGCQSIGSELCTVPEFARFVAAFMPGPHGEPPGRGVLKPESVTTMLEPLPKGIGYGFCLTNMQGDRAPIHLRADVLLAHFGGNPGWSAHFLIDTTRREGFVVANNSSLGFQFEVALQRLWANTVLGIDAGTDPDPEEGITSLFNRTASKIAIGLGVLLLAAAVWCGWQIARGKRRRARPRLRRSLLILAPPILATLLWWYVFYAPRSLPLPLGPGFLSIWTLPLVHYVAALLLGWMGVALLFAKFPRSPRPTESSVAAR
jgi:CubicO group peptidase (beta-lactamase class C family)